jgi:hypothetical protein
VVPDLLEVLLAQPEQGRAIHLRVAPDVVVDPRVKRVAGVIVPGLVGPVLRLDGSPAGFVGGKLFDLYQSYAMSFEVNMLIAAIGILALAFARLPQPKSGLLVAATA